MSVIDARPEERTVPHTFTLTPSRSEARSRDYDGGLKLQDLFTILRRRWLICLASMILSLGAAIAYYLCVPPTYESSSQLLIMRRNPDARLGGTARDAESDVTEDLLSTQIQLLQSRKVVSDALTTRQFDQLESITSQLDEGETATDYIIDNLYVTRGGEGQAADADVLNVSFRHTSNTETMEIVKAIVDQYQGFLRSKFQDVDEDAAELITSARTELATALADAEKAYQQYREQAPLLWNGDISTNVHRQRFDELQTELSQISIQKNEAMARLKVVERVVEEQNRDGVTDFERLVVIDEKNAERVGILLAVQQGEAETAEFQSRQPERMESARSEYQSLLQLQMRERRLLQDFGPRHPEVESIKEQIATASDFIVTKGSKLGVGEETMLNAKDLQDAYVTLLRRDLDTLSQSEAEMMELAKLEEEKAKELVKYELEGEMLHQNVARQQELYDAVVDRLREINLAKQYDGMINEVIAEAEIGEEVWPNLPICLALGLFGGVVLSGAGTTLRETRDRSFKSPDDIKEALGTQVMATIPMLRQKSDYELVSAIKASGSTIDASIFSRHLPQSREAELFRVLRTSIYFRSNEADLKVIMFTSPDPGAGKTTVTANLAVSIAQSGRRVLVIDADMRRPRIHSVFASRIDEGLTQVLAGSEEIHDVVQSTEVDNLYLMTCGPLVDNPAELLSSARFSEMLAVVRERYDFVLVDTPPVLAVADPCIAAPHVDGVVMVLRMTNEGRPKAIQCKSMLDDAGAQVVGTVVNGWSSRGQSYYGDYSYNAYVAMPQGRLRTERRSGPSKS